MALLIDKRALEIARFPGLIRNAMRDFRRLTGLTAVTTLNWPTSGTRALSTLLPAVHPRCTQVMQRTQGRAPCDKEWRRHLRFAGNTHRSRHHICPLNLQCACVPIMVGDEVLGLAKCVSGPEVSHDQFTSIVGVLEALVDRSSQEFQVFLLKEELRTLQTTLGLMRLVTPPASPPDPSADLSMPEDKPREGSHETPTLISRTMEYLSGHYADRDLTLPRVAVALGKNEKYISHMFARQMGIRMRTYITMLRVQRASELLLQTNRSIDQVASDSGYSTTARFRQAFHRSTGVSPSKYRLIFRTPASLRPDMSPPLPI